MTEKVVCIIQARLGSRRFPEKVISNLGNTTVIETVISRVMRASSVDHVVVAVPVDDIRGLLQQTVLKTKASLFGGSELDVQHRFIEAAQAFGASHIVRITADCPLVDWKLLDQVVATLIDGEFEYVSNISPPSFPDGLDVEAFTLPALLEARDLALDPRDFEHVTVSLRESGRFKTANISSETDLSPLRWTIDYESDLDEISSTLPEGFMEMNHGDLIREGFQGVTVSARERNEGSLMSQGQKTWSRAKELIPGGSMLLSKNPEMFLPEFWPSYYSKAKGIDVWDLDGNQFADFATMSVGACSLGYGSESVDLAVKKAVDDGVMSSLNSPAEVQLAEKLIQLHPWADMARFARSGGEANAIAVRIARTFTGKEKVAICGYHGWHDWYLAANLDANSNLDGHLLPGLAPAGVPRALLGTSVPFEYNDIESLEKMLRTGEFAAVQMEVSRNFGPQAGFLERVREICSEYKVVLIFDECTSGFRETFGGLHLKFGVSPDVAMFGKALGNGYAITAVVGREAVMQAAQESFISSTFWTERLGPVAALATLEEMERQRSWETLTSVGYKVKEIWRQVFSEAGLDARIGGLDALPTLALDVPWWPVLRTLLIQEMLERGFLTTSGFYASTAHTLSKLEAYEGALRDVVGNFGQLSTEEEALSLLRGRPARLGFKRLN